MTHSYPRRGRLALALQDVLLALVFAGLLVERPHGPLGIALLLAIPASLCWSLLTLHFPSSVDCTADAIAFHRYGRVHRFEWRGVERVRVRRFLVRDRVMVSLSPSPTWRGRYWLKDSLDGFDALVAALEQRARGPHSSP